MYNIPNFGNIPNLGNIPNFRNIPNFGNNSDEKSYYNILGISSNASQEEIKKAYRKLSLDNHPDRNNGNKEKSENFKEITAAYKTLNSESDRKKYDYMLNNNLLGNEDDLMDIFNNIINDIKSNPILKNCINSDPILFGGGININSIPFSKASNILNGFSQHEYKSKPASISKTINISLLQAYNSCKIPIDITRWLIESDIKYEETETIYIDIFKGIDNNEIITLENKGNIISNSNKGDIKIKVLINNNSIFERIGIDLIFKKSITLKESFCGFSFDLPYIDGREFKINNEAGNIIPPKFRKIIDNLGMKRDADIGNLIIEFDVIYPKQLTSKQIKELENIL